MYPKNKWLFLLVAVWLSAGMAAQDNLLILSQPDLTELRKVDEGNEATRFAAPVSLDLAPASAPDTYTYANGSWTWSQTFQMRGATGLGLFADHLKLPEGGTLTLHNDAGTQGPFTQQDASDRNRLFTGLLPGEQVTLTYTGPHPDTVPFHIWRLDHVYRPDRWNRTPDKGFGDSNGCQVNANCAAGDGWDDEKSGAGRINLVVAEGIGFCSGSLINNTAQDGRPLLLTGFHCMDGFTPLYDLWSVDFDYAGMTCDDPTNEPVPTKYVGVQQLSGRRDNDYLLLEITDQSFSSEDHYFAGWDRSDGDIPAPLHHFHHPMGDVQKLGVSDNDGATILNAQINWNTNLVTPPRHHFRMDYSVGDFMVGSSGSAFFNANRHVVGVLSGGNARCPGTSTAFISRLHMSWDGGDTDSTRLDAWLDPLGTGVMTLDGSNLLTKLFVRGQVVNHNGQPVEGATVTLRWIDEGLQEYVTDENGRYEGERPLGIGAYGVSGTYRPDDDITIGVDVGDIIATRSHILNLDTLSVLGQLAADVNDSGTIRVSDITAMTRAILGIGDWGERPNWVMLPIGFPLTPLPTEVDTPVSITLTRPGARMLTVNFFVVKTGDASLNAD